MACRPHMPGAEGSPALGCSFVHEARCLLTLSSKREFLQKLTPVLGTKSGARIGYHSLVASQRDPLFGYQIWRQIWVPNLVLVLGPFWAPPRDAMCVCVHDNMGALVTRSWRDISSRGRTLPYATPQRWCQRVDQFLCALTLRAATAGGSGRPASSGCAA